MKRLPLLLTLLLASAGSLCAEPARPYIIENGRPNAQIVIGEKPARTVKMAAEELQSCLEKMTGAKLPIVTDPDRNVPVQLYVGASRHTEPLGVDGTGLEHGAFRLVSGDHWLAFVGGDRDYVQKEPWPRNREERPKAMKAWDAITGEPFDNPFLSIFRKYDARNTGLWEFDLDNDGSFNAVTRFLYDLGARWYMPGELGEILPKLASVPLPKVDRKVVPDFALRNLYQMGANFFTGKKDEILWQMRLGTNQGQDLMAFGPNVGVSHGIGWVTRREEMKKAHPEMYILLGGKRQPDRGVPCLSSEALLQANVRFIRALFDTYDVPMVSVMPTDGFTSLCQCEACAPQGTPGRGRLGSLSDYVWAYVVRVAKEVQKTHPDRKIQCLAYTTYLLPPEKIDKLPSNVVVGIAQNRSTFNNDEWKTLFRDVRAQWREKITSGVPLYQYEYYLQDHPTRQWHGLPVLYPHLIVEDLRSLKGVSMGEYAEVNRGPQPVPTNLLNVYVTARYLWDVNQNLDSMLDEYYRLFYGPAEAPMRAFNALAEASWRDLTAEQVQKLFALLDEAKALAGDGVYGRRVALQRAGCEEGLKRVYAQKKEIDAVRLGYLDEAGIDPTANPDSLTKMPLKDLMVGGMSSDTAGEVSLGWTGGALYVRVVCPESDMGSLQQGAERRDDSRILRDDFVDIVVETPGKRFFEWIVNPKGVYADIDRARQGLDGFEWNASAKISTLREANRWVVEATIPAAALEAAMPSAAEPWKVNVGRGRPRGGQKALSAVVPTGRRTLLVPDRMLKVYFSPNHE